MVRVSILCLLFNLNFTLVAYWDLFVQEWGTESYIAAIAGPFIGLGCGYLLVTSLRVKDVGIRHATESTTAVRNIAPMLLMMIFPFGADPLVTVSITILNTVGITIVLLFVLMWRRAAHPRALTHQPTRPARACPHRLRSDKRAVFARLSESGRDTRTDGGRGAMVPRATRSERDRMRPATSRSMPATSAGPSESGSCPVGTA